MPFQDSPIPRATVLALLLTAALAAAGTWGVRGSVRYAQVVISWLPDTSAAERDRVTSERSLIVRRIDDGEWMCRLADTSAANIGALLAEPFVARARYLDPRTLQVSEWQREPLAERLEQEHPALSAQFGPSLRKLLRPAGVVPAFALMLLLALAASKSGRKWLADRIPESTPMAMGGFRVGLSLALGVVVLQTVSAPYRVACLLLLALFGVGIATRISFAGFVAVLTVASVGRLGAHDLALPIRVLWLLNLVPWGDALSLEETWRHRRGRGVLRGASRRYGLAMWIPVAMLGMAYSAAAFAKLDEGGIHWITQGAARYAFLIDATSAPFDLGRWVARSDVLSVVLSGGVIVAESAVVWAAVFFTPRMVAMAGMLALSLHTGFYVFQGVFWPGWWALLLAFLPWQSLTSKCRDLAGPWLRAQVPGAHTGHASRPEHPLVSVSVAIVLFLAVMLQPVASLFRYEFNVWLSDFPMYSKTLYESKAAFAGYMDAEEQPPLLVRFTPDGNVDGEVFADRLRSVDPNGAIANRIRTIAAGSAGPVGDDADFLGACAGYRSRFGVTAPAVVVLVDGWRFDWSAARFIPQDQPRRVGTLDLRSCKLSPD